MTRSSRFGLALACILGMYARDASAAVPVALPVGEPVADWEAAFALGGLVAGPIGEGAWVQLTDSGDYWLLRVRDTAGQLHDANVMPPQSAQDREDTIWLAMSLLKSASAPSAPSEVQRIDTPPPPLPPVASPTPPPAAPAAPAASPASPAPATATVARTPGAGPGWWAQAGGGAAWHGDTALGADVHLGVGLSVADRARIGLAVDLVPATGLPDLGQDRKLGATDVTAGVGLAFGSGVSLQAGVAAGVSMRAMSQAGEPVASLPVPLAGADVAVAIPLGGPLAIVPYAQLRYDLRAVTLSVADTDTAVEMSPLGARGGLALQISPKGRP